LTLIELVVVLVILAALAALVIPRLGFVKDSADTVTAAAAAQELANNLEVYKTTTGSYPLRMDSLILTGGTAVYDHFSDSSGTAPATPTWLTAEDFTAGTSAYWYSFIRAGMSTVMDHDAYTANSDPSSSGNVLRDFATDGGKLAVVVTTGTTGKRIMNAAGFIDATALGDTKLVALGIGPRCGLVGQTMQSIPRQSMTEPDQYARYIAIFAVYNTSFGLNTKSAALRCVVDSRGVPVDTRLNQYKNQQPVQE